MPGVQENELGILTIDKVAKLCGVSRHTIHRMRNAGDFPQPITICARPRWTRGQVDKWLESKVANAATKKRGGR